MVGEREREMMNTLVSHQIRPSVGTRFQKSDPPLSSKPQNLRFPLKAQRHDPSLPIPIQSANAQHTNPSGIQTNSPSSSDDDGIPSDQVKILAKFRSRHNYIRVLEVSRRADHPLAGSRLLLLDNPGNIHSISFLSKLLTSTYFDVFATFPPILPQGPIGILGFGAGSAARLILRLFPDTEIHGWELDPSVVSVGREYFGMERLEKKYPDKLFVYIGDALDADVKGGFSGILVDLFSKGSLIPELQDPVTWEWMKGKLRRGGRIMVNCGGRCVEPEDPSRDGDVVMEETLQAMRSVFADEVFVLMLGYQKHDSCVALTGPLPDLDSWKQALPSSLNKYVDMWVPFLGLE